jgi:hypothetical protein
MKSARRIIALAAMSAVSLLLSLVILSQEPVHAKGLIIKVFQADAKAAVEAILGALSLPPGDVLAIRGRIGRNEKVKKIQASELTEPNGNDGDQIVNAVKKPRKYWFEIKPPKPGDPKAQKALTRTELTKFAKEIREIKGQGGGTVKYASLGNLGGKRMIATYKVRLDPIGPVTFNKTKLADGN